MNDSPERSINSYLRFLQLIPLIPLFGFVFGFSYESVFYWALNIPLYAVADTSDIIKSAIFFITPTFFFMILGNFFGILINIKGYEDSKSNKTQRSNREKIVILAIFNILSILSISSFILFGIMEDFVALSLVIVGGTIILLTGILIDRHLNFDWKNLFAIGYLTFMLLVSMTAGLDKAHKVIYHFEKQEKVHIFTDNSDTLSDPVILLRSLSSGVLVVKDSGEIIILDDSHNSKILIGLVPPPWKGLLAESDGE